MAPQLLQCGVDIYFESGEKVSLKEMSMPLLFWRKYLVGGKWRPHRLNASGIFIWCMGGKFQKGDIERHGSHIPQNKNFKPNPLHCHMD